MAGGRIIVRRLLLVAQGSRSSVEEYIRDNAGEGRQDGQDGQDGQRAAPLGVVDD